MPKPTILNFDGISVRFASSFNDNQISTNFKFNIEKTFYTPAEYQELKAFFDHLAECNNSIITIKKSE